MSNTLTYPFKTDAAWANWGRTAVQDIVSDAAALGVPLDVAASLGSAAATYVSAYDAAVDPMTRSAPKIQAKDDALALYKKAARPVVKLIQANGSVSNERRTELGIRVYSQTKTPAPIPGVASVRAFATGPESARVIARDPLYPDSRARPKGVGQVLVFAMFGPEPSYDPADWMLTDASGKTTIDLLWPGLPGATTVWLSCQFQNTRKQTGPMSTPVGVRLAGMGGVSSTAAKPTESAEGLRIAA